MIQKILRKLLFVELMHAPIAMMRKFLKCMEQKKLLDIKLISIKILKRFDISCTRTYVPVSVFNRFVLMTRSAPRKGMMHLLLVKFNLYGIDCIARPKTL